MIRYEKMGNGYYKAVCDVKNEGTNMMFEIESDDLYEREVHLIKDKRTRAVGFDMDSTKLNLYDLREAKGLTINNVVEEISDRMAQDTSSKSSTISITSVGKWEDLSKGTFCTLDNLVRLADIFGVTLDYLVKRKYVEESYIRKEEIYRLVAKDEKDKIRNKRLTSYCERIRAIINEEAKKSDEFRAHTR